METQSIICPVSVQGGTCGREELVEKRKVVGVRPGSHGPATHHECGEHTFHTYSDDDQWFLCDCALEDT